MSADPANFDPLNITGKYILEGHTPVACPDLMKWAYFMESADRHVRLTRVGPTVVSTVFLGLDHNHMRIGPPILFETMCWIKRPHKIKLGGKSFDMNQDFLEEIQERCCTWKQAEAQHQAIIDSIRESGDKEEELAHSSNPRFALKEEVDKVVKQLIEEMGK